MVTYEHICKGCQHEWEESYSIKADPPTTCPECKIEGGVERLISGGYSIKMEMNDAELREDVVKGAAEMKRRAAIDINYRANLVGESKFHQAQLYESETRKNLKNI